MLMLRQPKPWPQALCVTCTAMLRSCLMEMRPTGGTGLSFILGVFSSFGRTQRRARKMPLHWSCSVHVDRAMLIARRDETGRISHIFAQAPTTRRPPSRQNREDDLVSNIRCTTVAITSTAAGFRRAYVDEDDDEAASWTSDGHDVARR